MVDVFTRVPLEGNALAVFPDGSGLSDLTMQKIARELNLSETVFVFPPHDAECAARLRIFTPYRELPFAGHPTVGTAFVLQRELMVPPESRGFLLEEPIGRVPIRIEPGEFPGEPPLIWLTTPPISFGRTYDPAVCAEALGLKREDLLDVAPKLATAGNPTIFIPLRTKAAVDGSSLDLSGFRAISGPSESACVFVFAPVPEGVYSRMFAPEYGIQEDPATGSATGPLAALMMQNNLISSSPGTRFISEQGTKMGRRSILHVHIHDGGIDVGGHVTALTEATMML